MNDPVKFGTSGMRGIADAVLDAVPAYTRALLAHLAACGAPARAIALARDLRVSSPAITAGLTETLLAAGIDVHDCGPIPTPALALHALAQKIPAIMVTGSHIPADRNGLKFFTATGEISKADEAGIIAHLQTPMSTAAAGLRHDTHEEASAAYRARNSAILPHNSLAGLRIGLFAHTTVAAPWLADALAGAGAEIIPLGRSATFVPVDTEAFSDPVFDPLPGWVADHRLDAIVSADADGDRPLLVDERGAFVRGDALGALATIALGATDITVPVTANSGLEAALPRVRITRTRVGSPFVLAAMEDAATDPARRVLGFEANGGLMLASTTDSPPLAPLPTRDAVLPLMLALGAAARSGRSVSALVASLPLRPALADRLPDMPQAASAALLAALATPAEAANLLRPAGEIAASDHTDGPRFTLADGAVIHFRASGNAPEMRCYAEAPSAARAQALLAFGLALIARWRDS